MEKSDEEKYEEVHVEGENFEEGEVEIEVTEISLNECEINEWISKLEELRERHGGSIELELDEESELMINYDSTEEDEEDDDEDDEDLEDEE